MATLVGFIDTFFPKALYSLLICILTFTVSIGWITVVAVNAPTVPNENFLVHNIQDIIPPFNFLGGGGDGAAAGDYLSLIKLKEKDI